MSALAYPDHVFRRVLFAEPAPSQKVYFASSPVTTSDATAGSPMKERFERLAAAWRNDIQFSSSLSEIFTNKNYQSIIGQGITIVPFILNDLKNGPDHWYWALAAITGANPAQHAPPGDITAISAAWLDWGKTSGIIR
jgi:hypothetical protein